ncbi:MAG: AraC family transcriptional regulator [Polyangiaceae bacterium]
MTRTRGSLVRQEYVGFRRSPAVPGLEVIDARDSPRQWRDVGTGFAVTFLDTWHGNVYYRGRLHDVEPGIAFCNQPTEALVATPQAGSSGSFSVLIVAPELLREWLSEYRAHVLRPQWRAVAQPISHALRRNFVGFLAAFRPEASALEQQAAASEIAQGVIRELVSGAPETVAAGGSALRGVARMRECLNDEDRDADLDTLAREAGLSRFQALRAFKRRYGLPPHAYQLCRRVSRARAMLLEGAAPAEVAAQCGFGDQSHFNRHFKRIVGVTPTQFARARPASASGVYRIYELGKI